MAMQPNVDMEYPLLGEFVDDGGGANSHTAVEAESAAVLRDVVRRKAIETGVPRFKLDEVVERVFAATGKEIEDLVCREIRVVMREFYPNPPPKQNGTPIQDNNPDRAATL